MEQEKDNFWFYIAGVIVLVVAFVFIMKSQKAALEPGVTNAASQAETKADLDKTFQRLHNK